MKKVKIYRIDQIQTVYRQFSENPRSVVMTLDNGYTWSSPPMDTGKWLSGIHIDMRSTVGFAFLQLI